MVLSDEELLRALRDGEMEIEPFNENNLTPNGYDLTVDAVLLPSSGEELRKGSAGIPPLTWFVVSTRESVRFGRALAAQLWLRSSYARKGVLASFGKVDAGFAGTLTVSAFNASSVQLEVPIGGRFCQLVVERLGTPALKDYPARSGRFQEQRGITLEPPSKSGSSPGAPSNPASSPSLLRGYEGDSPCLRHNCHSCCVETEMPLSSADMERIRGLGLREQEFCAESEHWLRLRRVRDGCVFLKDGRCAIYPSRPEGCRLYPVLFDSRTGRAMLDDECPHASEFGGAAGKAKEVLELARRLMRERFARLASRRRIPSNEHGGCP